MLSELLMSTHPVRLRAISLAVTDLCNQRCLYCYNHDLFLAGQCKPDVPTEDILGVIDLLTRQHSIQQIEITGGEPLLRGDILAILDHIIAKGIRIGIVSNASKIDASRAAELARRKISHVQTTFLAKDAAAHDALAGAGSFAARKTGVKHLIAAGVPVIGAFVCTKENFSGTGETLEMMYEWGMREHFFFMRFCPSRHSICNRTRLAIVQEELQEALAQANRFGTRHGIPVHNKIPVPMCLLHSNDYPQVIFSACGAALEGSECYVDQQGNVRLCASNAAVLGNIRNASLDDLLGSDTAREWKESCAPDCSPCDLRSTCRGGCPIAEEDPIQNDVWAKRVGRFKPTLVACKLTLPKIRVPGLSHT